MSNSGGTTTVSITIGFKKSLEAIINTCKPEIIAEITTQSKILQTAMRKNIAKGSRTGRTYKKKSVIHQASAPGEYPKTDTGELVSSIYKEDLTEKLEFKVGSNKKYARHLEFGTSKMQARPFMFRTFKENKKNIIKGISQVISKNVTESIEKNKNKK